MPKLCPSCGSHLHCNQETIIIRCDNGLNFPSQNYERICHFGSTDVLNIDGLGKKQMEILLKESLLKRSSGYFIFAN
jgi:DNA ligase (NAD+)